MSEIELFLFILKQICLGSLISGLIIFLLTLFIQGSHIFDHDASLDHDIDHDITLDHDISMDHDVSFDHDVSLDHDITLDHEGLDIGHVGVDKDINVGLEKDLDSHDHDFGSDTPTPFMLLLGTFMITFGGSGTILVDSNIHPLFLIFLILIIPFVTTLLISKLWSKLAIAETYETPLETIKIDDKVKTLTVVDTEGGLILIETVSIHGPVKLSAKTKYGAIGKDMAAYVVEIKGNTLIIDEWPSSERKEKPIPEEGTIKWE